MRGPSSTPGGAGARRREATSPSASGSRRSNMSVVIVRAFGPQVDAGSTCGQRTCCSSPNRYRPRAATDVKPSPWMQVTIASLTPACSVIDACAEKRSSAMKKPHSRTSTRPTMPWSRREGIPAGRGIGLGVDGHRAATFSCTGWAQRPAPSSAGSSSNSRPKTSPSAAAAAGRTSSTVDRAAELARHRRERRVLEPAGRDPVGERCRIEVDVERVAVRRHPARHVDADRGDLAGRRSRATRRSGPRSARPRSRGRRASG